MSGGAEQGGFGEAVPGGGGGGGGGVGHGDGAAPGASMPSGVLDAAEDLGSEAAAGLWGAVVDRLQAMTSMLGLSFDMDTTLGEKAGRVRASPPRERARRAAGSAAAAARGACAAPESAGARPGWR